VVEDHVQKDLNAIVMQLLNERFSRLLHAKFAGLLSGLWAKNPTWL
jgi:hypothetical protein